MLAVKENLRPATERTPRLRHCLGAHLSIAGGMHRAIEAALRLRCGTVQVFVKNQRQWRAAPLDPADLERWHALRCTPGFGPIVAHATYLINLAAPGRQLNARSREAFAQELRRAQMLDIPYLVLHPGSATGAPRHRAIARVCSSLNRIYDWNPDLRVTTLLETTAGQGTALGHTFEELAEIINGIEDATRVGVCIDTCHVFAAGYDIRDPEKFDGMIDLVARTVGLERVRCWHLNDSKAGCGARVDRHEHIGRGQLGTAAFRNLLADSRFVAVPMILETPKGTDPAGQDFDRLNLRRLRTIERRYNDRSTARQRRTPETTGCSPP